MRNLLLVFALFLCGILAGAESQPRDPGVMDLEACGCTLLVHGDTLYMTITGKNAAIAVFDIRDAANPKLRTTYRTENFPRAMTIDGTRLYVADTRDLLVFDIADPGALKLVLRKEITEDPIRGPVSVAVSRGDVYLAGRSGGITKNDIPQGGFYARSICIGTSGRIYAAGPRYLMTLDSDPLRVLEIPLSKGTPIRLRENGGDLYLALGFHGLCVFRDTARLESVWERTDIIGINTGRFVRPGFDKNGIPVKNAAVPVQVETGPLGRFSAYGTFVYDMAFDAVPAKTVFLAAGESGVVAADLTDPKTIRPFAVCEALLWKSVRGVACKDRILYACDTTFGLRVIDVSDPSNMKLAGPGVPLD